MQKQTLQFLTLEKLAAFAKCVSEGYLVNTNNLTLTGRFVPEQIQKAVQVFGAVPTMASDSKAYSY